MKYAQYGFASLVAHITAMYAAFASVAVAAAGAPVYLVALAFAFMSNLCMSLTHYAAGTAPNFFGLGYVNQGLGGNGDFLYLLSILLFGLASVLVGGKFLDFGNSSSAVSVN